VRPSNHTIQAAVTGILPVPGWECFFGRNDCTLHDLAFHVWVVRGERGIGLIDTGLPVDEDALAALQETGKTIDPASVYREVTLLPEILARAGVAPTEVAWVAITQTITYHTGGLVGDLLPNARVYASRAGMLEFLLDRPGHPPHDFYFTPSTWSFLRDLLVAGRLHLVDEPTEIVPGVWFETTGGHHPGSAAVRVHTDVGVVGILETAFLARNVDEELPIGIAEDVAGCREAIRRYRRECDVVLADHDPSLAARYPLG
jgi:hypothetical protein